MFAQKARASEEALRPAVEIARGVLQNITEAGNKVQVWPSRGLEAHPRRRFKKRLIGWTNEGRIVEAVLARVDFGQRSRQMRRQLVDLRIAKLSRMRLWVAVAGERNETPLLR